VQATYNRPLATGTGQGKEQCGKEQRKGKGGEKKGKGDVKRAPGKEEVHGKMGMRK
jgi:hypothetical protein